MALSNDLDPDLNLYSDLNNCDYFTEYNLNNKLAKTLSANLNCLSFFHLNIRSLSRHFDNFSNVLATINSKFWVIGISETWLQNADDFVDLKGYNFVHNYRHGRVGGGGGLYFDHSLNYKTCGDLNCYDCEYVESLFLEICVPKGKDMSLLELILFSTSHLQNDKIDFVQYIHLLMTKISKENKLVYLMGDFNLNLLNHHCHQPTSEFLDIMYSHMLFPLITRPFRVTSYSATLIDNIFTNHVENQLFSGLIFRSFTDFSNLSDHLPIFCFSYEQFFNKTDSEFVFYP